VARRTREIGVRMALGAVPGDVVWLVMREVLALVGTGIALGLVAAWGLGRVISSQRSVSATDPATIAAPRACSSSSPCSPATCPPGARHARRPNPVLALRYE
jgi:ABC-type antimicrobial peptide transport system permease subunit